MPAQLHQPPPLQLEIVESRRVGGVALSALHWLSSPKQPWWQWQRQFSQQLRRKLRVQVCTRPHCHRAPHDNRISGAPEAILAYRYQFQVCARSIKPISKCIWLGCLCTQILQMDISRDFKFCLGLTSPSQFRTSERRVNRNYARRWQRVERLIDDCFYYFQK